MSMLMDCWVCGEKISKDVSDNGQRCPHCGYQYMSDSDYYSGDSDIVTKGISPPIIKGLILCAIIAILIWGMASMGKKTQREILARHYSGMGIPLASQPVSEWKKLVLPPGGRSDVIPSAPGTYLSLYGQGYQFHVRYRDGSECVHSPGGAKCPGNRMIGGYVTNMTYETNVVSVAINVP